MRGALMAGILFGLSAAFAACTDAQRDCNRNPELACFVQDGAGGSSGTTTTTMSTGGTPTCGNLQLGKCVGDLCANSSECVSGHCADGVCCDQACDGACQTCWGLAANGICKALPPGSIDSSSPNGETCAAKGGCGETMGYCSCDDGVVNGDEIGVDCGGSCPSCPIGESCGSSNATCASGHCVDGVCCASACDTGCLTCSLPVAPGACVAVPAGAVEPDCGPPELCNGNGLCALVSGQACSAAPECVNALCSAGFCATCAQTADCSADQVCDTGTCVSPAAAGTGCQSNLGCKSGQCVDGVCCAEPCNGTCMACNSNYTGQPSGVCAPILAGYDPHDECVGPGPSRACSGAAADVIGDSACGSP